MTTGTEWSSVLGRRRKERPRTELVVVERFMPVRQSLRMTDHRESNDTSIVPVGFMSRRNGGVDMCHGQKLDKWSQQGSETQCRWDSGRSAHTTGTWLAVEPWASAVRRAVGSCGQTSLLRRLAGQQHLGLTGVVTVEHQVQRPSQSCSSPVY